MAHGAFRWGLASVACVLLLLQLSCGPDLLVGRGSQGGSDASGGGSSGQPPDCSDSIRNGDETDVDCGGEACPACIAGQSCSGDDDCATAECYQGSCCVALTPEEICSQIECGTVSDTCGGPMDCGGCSLPQTQCGSLVPNVCGCTPGFHDIDGNSANGCEYACVAIAGPDDPDPGFVDSNCDGIDGDIGRAVFVSPSGSDSNDGSMSSPLKTLSAATAVAAATGHDVYADQGTYFESLVVVGGVSLFGGFDSWTSLPGAPIGYWSRHVGASSVLAGGSTAVTVNDVSQPTLIDRFVIQAADGATLAGGDGEPSIGVLVSGGVAQFTLRGCAITSGQGGNAADGVSGAAGMDGGKAQGGNACNNALGPHPGGSAGQSACGNPGGDGGQAGGSITPPGAGQDAPGGGLGGMAGTTTGTLCQTGYAGQPGQAGASGWAGAPGVHGAAGGAVGVVALGMWAPASGGTGTAAGNGVGGGGGGGGGWGSLAGCPANYSGGSGGGGGGGGCGGTGGTGGHGGGGSFAVLVIDATAQLTNVSLTSGAGGNGGAGGIGGAGGAGGAGSIGGSGCGGSGNGASGGPGGPGGNGGHGGGGGGGPSIALAQSNSVVSVTGLLTASSTGGFGGASAWAPGADGMSAANYTF